MSSLAEDQSYLEWEGQDFNDHTQNQQQQNEEQAMSENQTVVGQIESIETWPDGNFKAYRVNGVSIQLSKAKQEQPQWMSYKPGDTVRVEYAPIQKGKYTNNYAQSMVTTASIQPTRAANQPERAAAPAQLHSPDKSLDISVLALVKGLVQPGDSAEIVLAKLRICDSAWTAYKKPAAPKPEFDDFGDEIPF